MGALDGQGPLRRRTGRSYLGSGRYRRCFGALTTGMIDYLQSQGVEVRYGYEVKDLDRESDGTWTVSAT